MNRAQEEEIATRAARQHGVITHRQLIEAAVSPSAIVRRVQSGRMRPLYRGVYLASLLPLARTREMAAVLAVGPGAVTSHLSAATVLGWQGTSSLVDVSVTASRRPRPGIRLHLVKRLGATDRTIVDGIPTTTPIRTLVDLAGTLSVRELEAVVAWAERERLVSREALTARITRDRGRRGIPALSALLGTPGGPALTRSEAEARFLALIREGALPPPECNVRIGRYEVDFFWRAAGIAVEVDGFRYHASRPNFERDRRKDAVLVASGITVLRLSWRQITDEPVATAVRIAQALALHVGQPPAPLANDTPVRSSRDRLEA